MPEPKSYFLTAMLNLESGKGAHQSSVFKNFQITVFTHVTMRSVC